MKRSLQDLASLAARMGVGGIFFANGWHKLEAGLTMTGAQFAELHAPMPGLWAAATMLIELVGGTLLIAGLAVPAVGLLLFAEALAVFVLTAGNTGLPLTGGDIRLIVALGAASVLLSVTGGGRLSADHMVVIKRREAEDADDFAADAEAEAVIAALRDREGAPSTRELDAGGAGDDKPSDDKPSDGKPSDGGAQPTTGDARSGSGSAAGSGAGSESAKPSGDGATGPRPRSRRAKKSNDQTAEPNSEAP